MLPFFPLPNEFSYIHHTETVTDADTATPVRLVGIVGFVAFVGFVARLHLLALVELFTPTGSVGRSRLPTDMNFGRPVRSLFSFPLYRPQDDAAYWHGFQYHRSSSRGRCCRQLQGPAHGIPRLFDQTAHLLFRISILQYHPYALLAIIPNQIRQYSPAQETPSAADSPMFHLYIAYATFCTCTGTHNPVCKTRISYTTMSRLCW